MVVNRKLVLDQMDNHTNHHNNMDHSSHSMMKHSNVKPTWVIPHPNLNYAYIAGNGSDEIIEVNLDTWKVS